MKKLLQISIALLLILFNTTSYSQTLSADAGQDSLICLGGSMVLGGFPAATGGTPPYTYNWIPAISLDSATFSNPVATPFATTTYQLTVTDSLGDTATAYVVVYVAPSLSVSAGTDLLTCYGDSVQLNGSGGTFYSWSPATGLDDPNIPNPFASPAATTTYTLTSWDANGCSGTDSITLTVSPPMNVTVVTTPASCAGCSDGSATVIVTGGITPYSYLWGVSPPVTTSWVSGLAPGAYTITVTDANGCTNTLAFVISVGQCMADFTLLADTLVLHHYFIINNSIGVAPIQYVWNWGDGSPQDSIAYPTHTYSTAGFYSVTLSITDSTNCNSSFVNMIQVLRSNNAMITVDVIPPLPTGINETQNTNNLLVYPNPASRQISISTLSGSEIEFYNLQGEKVKTLVSNSDTSVIDISHLAKGIYQVRCHTPKGLYKAMFVKE